MSNLCGTSDLIYIHMGMRVNLYPPIYIGSPIELFFYRVYEYKIVIAGDYLPVAYLRDQLPSVG